MRSRLMTVLIVVVVLAVAGVGVLYTAGNGPMDPPAPPGSTSSYTLAQVYDRLNTGAMDAPHSGFTEPASGPGPGTMQTLDEIMAQAPVADNANGATAADVKEGRTFWGLRTDGTWGNTTGTLAFRGFTLFQRRQSLCGLRERDGDGHGDGANLAQERRLFRSSGLCCRKHRRGRATNGRMRPDRQLHARRLAIAKLEKNSSPY